MNDLATERLEVAVARNGFTVAPVVPRDSRCEVGDLYVFNQFKDLVEYLRIRLNVDDTSGQSKWSK